MEEQTWSSYDLLNSRIDDKQKNSKVRSYTGLFIHFAHLYYAFV